MTVFYKLNFESTALVNLIANEIRSRTDWITSHGFDILKLNNALFLNTPLAGFITKYNGTPVCFKMNPMTWYDWHTDEFRQCAINMLIDGANSMCFFGDRQSRDIVNLTELKYENGSAYLINTQVKHAILNLNNTRYMLSIGFNNPTTYAMVLQYAIENEM